MTRTIRRGLVWLRRDLRLDDNAALATACAECDVVALGFVLDPAILRSPRIGPPLVQFFFDALTALGGELRALGSDLVLVEGDPSAEIPRLAHALAAPIVYCNDDYEPSARQRDAAVARALAAAGVELRVSLDHVYYGADEVVQTNGAPYRVFGAYHRRWLERLATTPRLPFPPVGASARLVPRAELPAGRAAPRPHDYGFAPFPAVENASARGATAALRSFVRAELEGYAERRDVPALPGTSRLSPHLRAGTIGIRRCLESVRERDGSGARAWRAELIWRDFYQQILAHVPRVADEPFDARAATIGWRNDDADWRAWCSAATGYPIVDAAMRQLNATGWMHNRLRMIVASFLSKHLLIDYRWGERYFEQHLIDADLAANNGGWQWSASTGTDPVPYFRVFNPVLQGRRFDPSGAFVRAQLPALGRVPDAYVHAPWTMPPLIAAEAGFMVGRDYPAPIVDHGVARTRALAAYRAALANP